MISNALSNCQPWDVEWYYNESGPFNALIIADLTTTAEEVMEWVRKQHPDCKTVFSMVQSHRCGYKGPVVRLS